MATRLRQAFFDNVPDGFLLDSGRAIISAYRTAHVRCEELFEASEAHDALPIVRRGLIEQDWRSIARRHAGVRADAVPNVARTSYHTTVTCGAVTLTQSAVPHPQAIVREARFREGYAETLQYTLFPNVEEKFVESDALYGVLLHGPHPKDRSIPGFIHVAFPAADWSYYVDRIDILGRFQVLRESVLLSKLEEISAPITTLRAGSKPTRSSVGTK